MRIISLTNLKGGSAKSTTAFNIIGALIARGDRVLAIDLDPQQTLSISYLDTQVADIPLSQALIEDRNFINAISPTSYENLYAVAADAGLKGIKSGQTQIEGVELRLRSCLKRTDEAQSPSLRMSDFDWVIIDCPPSLDRLTMNALVAADYVLVPVDPGAGGRTALADTLEYVSAAQKWYNPTLKILGLLINNVNSNTVYDQTTEEAVRDLYGDQVFQTVIPSSVRVRESAEMQIPMVFCKGSEYRRFVEVYQDLCQEILVRTGATRGTA
ncbi:MAG: ParA family protein [Chloroflexota bacterium]